MSDPAFEAVAGSVASKVVVESWREGWSEGFRKGSVLIAWVGGAWVGVTLTAVKTGS